MFDMGKRICKLRRDAYLSQKQLGEKIGKSASTIGSYENDTAVPTLENAAALAEALHVSLDYLLYGEKGRTLPLQKMSENRVQLLTDLAQEFAAPTSHGAATVTESWIFCGGCIRNFIVKSIGCSACLPPVGADTLLRSRTIFCHLRRFCRFRGNAVVFWGHSKGSQHRRADAEYIRPETNPIQVAFKMEELL